MICNKHKFNLKINKNKRTYTLRVKVINLFRTLRNRFNSVSLTKSNLILIIRNRLSKVVITKIIYLKKY